jgi:hypothetical protein
MRLVVRLFVLSLIAAVSALCFQAGTAKSSYRDRRQRLRKDLDGVFVLFGTTSNQED